MARWLPPLTPGAAMRWDLVDRLLPTDLGDVLEIGCGQGGLSTRMSARSHSFLGLEPDPRSFATAQQRLRGAVLNITADELPSDLTFDTVCAFEVIEHLPDDVTALTSWVERIRPGGTLIISAPAHAHRLGPSDALVGHYRRYDSHEMAQLLATAGLVDVTVRLYGGPIGWVLEEVRNALARFILARTKVSARFDERTAGSGRFLQLGSSRFAQALQLLMYPLILVQRKFPNRGVALIGIGRRPAVGA